MQYLVRCCRSDKCGDLCYFLTSAYTLDAESQMAGSRVVGEELKKFLQLARKGPIPFGINLASKDADTVIVMHRRRSPAELGKLAKAEGSGGKVAFGNLTVDGKEITLICERNLSGLAKGLQMHLKTQKLSFSVTIGTGEDLQPETSQATQEPVSKKADATPIESSDQSAEKDTASNEAELSGVDDEEDDLDLGSLEGDELRGMLMQGKRRTLSFGYCPTADEAEHVIVIDRKKKPTALGKAAKRLAEGGKVAFGTFTVEGRVIKMICERQLPTIARKLKKYLKTQSIRMDIVILDPDGNEIESDLDEADATAGQDEGNLEAAIENVREKLYGIRIPAEASDSDRRSIDATIDKLHQALDIVKSFNKLQKVEAAVNKLLARTDSLGPEESQATETSQEAPNDLPDRDELVARIKEVVEQLKPLLLPEENGPMKRILTRLSLAVKNGHLELADSILFALERRVAGDLIPLAQLKGSEITDAEHRQIMHENTGLSPEEVARLEAWIETNYMAEETAIGLGPVSIQDEVGGVRLADALKGKSDLGELTEQQSFYLASRVSRKWLYTPLKGEDGAKENIKEFTQEMLKDPAWAKRGGEIFWRTYQHNNQFEEGANKEGFEQRSLSLYMLESAIELAPAEMTATLGSTIGGKGLAEWASGWRKKEPYKGRPLPIEDIREPYFKKIGKSRRNLLMRHVADGALSTEDTDQFTSFMFGSTSEYDLEDSKAAQESWAHLLGSTVARNNCLTENSQKDFQAKLENVLKTEGGRDLLFRHNIDAPLRNWALNQLAPSNDPLHKSLKISEISEGWESDAVGKAFAKEGQKQALSQFPEPVSFSVKDQKGALGNTIGQAFGMPPTLKVDPNETPEQARAREAAGFNHEHYDTEKAPLKAFFNFIEEKKIDTASITPIPITFMSNEIGTAVFKVMRLETPNGPVFFDHRNNTFDSVNEWEEKNELPPGKITYPEELVLGNKLKSRKTPADSTKAWIWDKLDKAAMIAGTIAGIVVLVGTGGAAAPLVAGAAAAYGGARAGIELNEKSELGHDITDLGDDEIRALWLEAGSSVLSIGAIGGGMRAARLLQQGGKMSRAGANIVAGMTHAGNLVDAVALGDTINTLSKNWDKMSPEEKSHALLSLSFQFGMNAASNKANGGRFADNFNFRRTRNQLEHGTPFNVDKNPDLSPGEVKVKYDPPTEKNPYPSGFRIEYNGDKPPSRLMIELHSQAASAMEASVALQKRYKSMVKSGQEPEAGTAPWEAQFELKKISGEAENVLKQLERKDLSMEDRTRLQARMDELNGALIEERKLLDAWEADKSTSPDGRGHVAAPLTGEMQRQKRKWPDPPKDHIWVAGPGNKPHLRRKDGSKERMYYLESEGKFIRYSERPDADVQVVGSGDNEMTFLVRGDGRTAETHAVLRKYHVGAERSAAELEAQRQTGKKGLETDEGGHMVGHRFGLDHGADNMFPQDANFNKGAYKAMENEFAAWIDAGCEVRMSVTLSKYRGDRPQKVLVTYNATDKKTGKVVYRRTYRFANDGKQKFNRLSREQIESKVSEGLAEGQ
ncbi:DUF4781 domain-containing protein [Marimonas sp. MJW-29]|uniref:DUF4781 domain-containing protein n=1 Tax=Sulfitobacter sediminis TaxID=3234186 RepID=A0ABV3RUW0_9RHOB